MTENAENENTDIKNQKFRDLSSDVRNFYSTIDTVISQFLTLELKKIEEKINSTIDILHKTGQIDKKEYLKFLDHKNKNIESNESDS